MPGLAARFIVQQKKSDPPESERIPTVARVRLFDRSSGRYRKLELPTDIVEGNQPRPVGVRLFDGSRMATTAVVLRWTTRTPPPPPPSSDAPNDPRWRWGLLSVAHLFAGPRSGLRRAEPRVERAVVCGAGPATIEGSLVAAGRLPGGPDAAVVETGLDRLWLSGFLPQPAASPVQVAELGELRRWIREGVSGYSHGAGAVTRWRFAMYLPEQSIAGLGRLSHLIRYTAEDSQASELQLAAPFGPGSSGAALVAGGAPLGIQVAAENPAYRTGYGQAFAAILPWLSQRLGATEVAVVRIV